MGVTRVKKTVQCECGCDYGGYCGKMITFLFCYNRSCDIGSLYIKNHSEKTDSKYEHFKSMQDNEINALVHVLTTNNNDEELTEEEKQLL